MSTAGFTLHSLAERFGLEWVGDGECLIHGVATLAGAQSGQLSFLANPLYRRELLQTRAGAVVLRAEDAAASPCPALVAKDPYVAFARIAALFETPSDTPAGIHPSAVIDPAALIDAGVSVGPHCVIGARSRIERGASLGPGCVIGDDCVVGVDARLVARVTLVTRVRLGARVLVHPGAVLGADGFGLAMDGGRWIKVPQLGGVVIGSDCEIGANTCIDRGALDDTRLGDDVRIDNLVQIGHNVQIGDHTAVAGSAAIAGSAKIGRYCLIGGGVGIVGHLTLCDKVTLTARSLVTHSIDTPGQYSSGVPLQESRQWRRNAARFRQLDALARRIMKDNKDNKDA
ncbi:UDP-3-O-(3-hydroxymyristoyl)glucosamine N-acyltransferase [Aquimonas sp.]|uniref:UDP-3-O-(3-hydroxymyristoyl)glucosamine N-acyltransferase n=1 Tax=Aquimonas sp. TaxID=1872588 RepID=UPI0037C0730C